MQMSTFTNIFIITPLVAGLISGYTQKTPRNMDALSRKMRSGAIFMCLLTQAFVLAVKKDILSDNMAIIIFGPIIAFSAFSCMNALIPYRRAKKTNAIVPK